MNWIEEANGPLGTLHGDRFGPSTDAPVRSFPESPQLGRSLLEGGIIRQIRDVEIISKPLPIFSSAILLGGQDANGRFIPPRICGGSGFTEEQARARACGEAVERYCAARYDEAALRLSSYLDLNEEAVLPEAFALYGGDQYDLAGFEYRPFRQDTRINWVQGFSLTRQRPVFVPAAFVYLPYWPLGGETAIGLLPSTGLACGRSLVEASLQGIFEVIERDAIMIMWLHQMARRLDPASIGSGRVGEIIQGPGNGVIRIFDITTDVPIPTRFSVLTDSYRGRSLVACGAATKWNSAEASEKSVLEALVVRQAVQKIIRTYPPRNYGKDYRKVREADDHLNLYTNPDMLRALDFLTQAVEAPDAAGEVSLAGAEAAHQLKTCLDLLAARNLEAIVVDITRPEAREMGLCVVRAIIPGMIPLSFGTDYVCTGGHRLSEVSQSPGHDLRGGRGRLNPLPHPFA